MQLLRRLIARLRSWRLLYPSRQQADALPLVTALPVRIHREVSPAGVRVFCLCGCCGARLGASATLCDECARGRSPSTPPS